MPGAHKTGAAISGPRIAGGNFMDITLFLNISGTKKEPKPKFLSPDIFCREQGNRALVIVL